MLKWNILRQGHKVRRDGEERGMKGWRKWPCGGRKSQFVRTAQSQKSQIGAPGRRQRQPLIGWQFKQPGAHTGSHVARAERRTGCNCGFTLPRDDRTEGVKRKNPISPSSAAFGQCTHLSSVRSVDERVSLSALPVWNTYLCTITKSEVTSRWKVFRMDKARWARNVRPLLDVTLSFFASACFPVEFQTLAGTGGGGGGVTHPPAGFLEYIFVYQSIVTIFFYSFPPTLFTSPPLKISKPWPPNIWHMTSYLGSWQAKMRSVAHNLQTSPFLPVIWMWTCSTK